MNYSVLCLAAMTGLTVACRDSGIVATAPVESLAYTRFVHAVPDTGATDWRFIDTIENSPAAFALTFRAFTPYQATASGNRHLRIFPTTTDINLAPKFLIDSSFSLDANTYYTIVHVGLARPSQSPADYLLIIKDDIPSVASAKFAFRLVHLGTGLSAMDAYVDSLGTGPLPASRLATGITFANITTYSVQDTGRVALRLTNSGQASPIVATAVAPAGEAANPSLNLTAIGGTRMGMSAISAFLFPRSVAGSSAPQAAAFTSPAIVFLVDKHPR